MPDLAQQLAAHRGSGYVVAPAGFGKTHLVAQAVAHSTGRQLVLTHTYAGVNALRKKMRERAVSSRLFHVDTIASWALRLSLSYRSTSGWSVSKPDGDAWDSVYEACDRLLDSKFVRRIVRASYAGMYVDEYQDCSLKQHAIVQKLAQDLPCRVLGDPLQAIFDFPGQECVDWGRHVQASGDPLGRLDTPHRWNLVGAAHSGQGGHWFR